MKKKIICVLMLCFALTGCGSKEGSRLTTENQIDKVLQDGVNSEQQSTEVTTETTTEVTTEVTTEATTEDTTENETDATDEASTEEAEELVPDIDMTEMSSDMVYATVYQLMTDPNTYIGKIIRVKGNFCSSFYDVTNQWYHCVLIQDALACCAQGLEFIWEDGSHVYPDDYPAEYTEVIVTGTFELYEEEGYIYCRLNNATMEWVQQN
ncbi:MAG: hypothetical protein ACI4D8_00050 [Wujia sp.]